MEERKRKSERTSLTVDDVARKAGVSRTAVSYVLNEKEGQRNKHVSAETRAKVVQAIQELDFRPHALARALSKGHSEEIVLVMGTPFTPFAMEMLSSLQQQALVYGYTPVMYLSQGFSDEEKRNLHQTVFARHPIGIITSPFDFKDEEVALAQQKGIKHIIFIGFHAETIEGTYSIVFPSKALGYLAARHLLERGHRHLALVQPDDAVQEEGFSQRLEGMHAAIAEEPGVTLDILPLHLAASSAYELVETSLVGANRPTGIYAFSDEYAVVLLGALTRLGIQVPQEIALVGTDNLPLGEFVWPSLTSMSFDALDIGKRAADMLHLLHQGQPLPEALTAPLIPQLIPRQST
ncbi:MAG TPA: LacI family DNA-binding transcriptional regulator [Ktedonobacteraceae bacterium]|nr:LacI family DNA-binding transcriptional regulator [Ktedonobacteraceae bacterium]